MADPELNAGHRPEIAQRTQGPIRTTLYVI